MNADVNNFWYKEAHTTPSNKNRPFPKLRNALRNIVSMPSNIGRDIFKGNRPIAKVQPLNPPANSPPESITRNPEITNIEELHRYEDYGVTSRSGSAGQIVIERDGKILAEYSGVDDDGNFIPFTGDNAADNLTPTGSISPEGIMPIDTLSQD